MDPAQTPSRDQIKAVYTKLAAETGDLYFILENARAHVASLEARMASLKEQRAALQKAFDGAPAAPEAVTEAVTESV